MDPESLCKVAEQGDATAQNNLAFCYYRGDGVAKDAVEALKWYRKAAEQGDATAQYNLGVCYYRGDGVAKDAVEALKWYRKAAEQGNAHAQFSLGVCYAKGNGASKDMVEAAKWYRKAAEQGDAAAQNNLGGCFKLGNGVVKDMAEAVKWYRKAAEQDNLFAQGSLGFCYAEGKGVPKDMVEAVKWYRKAAERGNVIAQFNLGICYTRGAGVLKDMAEAVRWYREAAEQGDANAQYNLGVCFERGDGVAKDMVEAVKWFRRAAEQGHANAEDSLGACFEHGKGVAKDMVEAVKWYRRAAERGHAISQANLGACCEHGDGVTKDLTEALKWYHRAAEQGDATAQNNLAFCYYRGGGVAKDAVEAVKWYRKAAEQGDANAQNNLGTCYELGNGVPKDMAEAVKWYRKAADQGDAQAQKNLAACHQQSDGMAKSGTATMTPDQNPNCCEKCGGDQSNAPSTVSIPCKCGASAEIQIGSIDRELGTMVTHEIAEGRCPYYAYVPPTVLCPSCWHYLVKGWQSLVVHENPDEAAMEFTDPNIKRARALAREVSATHGNLTGLHLRTGNDYQIDFEFADGVRVSAGSSNGEIVNLFAFGYWGGGPRNFRAFLDELGICLSVHEVTGLKPGTTFKVVGASFLQAVPALPNLTYRQKHTASTAVQTTWECTNPNCETRKKGLFMVASQPAYARVLCKECGAPMQIASSGPHTDVVLVGQMPETVLSAGALPVRRAKQGFWGRLSGSPAHPAIDDPDIAFYPEIEAACRNPVILHPDLYGWLQASYLFLVRNGSRAATLIVVRCASHEVPATVIASFPVGVHAEAHFIKGYQVFGIYPLVWHGHPDFWNSETRVEPYDMIGANEEELADLAQRYSWRKMFYLLTQADTRVLFIDERNQVVVCKSAAQYAGQDSDYARLLGMLESCSGKQMKKPDSMNLTSEYNRAVDIDAVRTRVHPLR